MENEYKMYGSFLASAKRPGEKVKMVMLRDRRGVCVMNEADWKKIKKRM